MNKKMTSGEIAKKAGISQKAVRLYDEKGLLKPSDYSEGNYRLYDNEALLVLEKIIALKQIGFSLEEIKENLVGGSSKSIIETLREQVDLMEAKRYELEKAVKRINAVIDRSNGEPDWDDVAEILKSMQMDQDRDEGHFFALNHTKGQLDWYVKIYQYLQPVAGERVLDLGCGFSKVWRNNWTDIPDNVRVDGYDLRGSWADDFEKFVADNSHSLADGTKINLYFENVEEEATWKHILGEEKYSMIIAHYVTGELKDKDAFAKRLSGALADGGFCSLNEYGNVPRNNYGFWYDIFKKLNMDCSVLDVQMDKYIAEEKRCKEILAEYFSSCEEVIIPSPFVFENIDDILEDLKRCIPGKELFLEANREKLTAYFNDILDCGGVEIPHDGSFWRLRK